MFENAQESNGIRSEKMSVDEIAMALRENAEWCDANEYEVPLCMGDNQRAAADLIEFLQARTKVTGETSDGYHTFNELYHHRAVLFSVICNDRPALAWKSKLHHDGTMFDSMFIVGIQTPEGQATYHYDIDPYWDMFRVPELPQAPEWDGHTSEQAIERIGNLPSMHTNLSASQRREKAAVELIDEIRSDATGDWSFIMFKIDKCAGAGGLAMELIDKAALMARIQSEGKHQASQIANRHDPVVLAYGDCYAMAKTAPAIDAVEVVRCCDCKYSVAPYKDSDDNVPYLYCYHPNLDEDALSPKVDFTDFCSYGRRE